MKDEIKQLIETELGATVDVMTNDDVHFAAIVRSEKFSGENRVTRQRMVNAILKDKIDSGELHAISFQAKTPEE